MPTAKLGHSSIKFQASYPDGVELIKVERTIFENSQKPFCKKVFCGAFFQKSDINSWHKLTTLTAQVFKIALSFLTNGAYRRWIFTLYDVTAIKAYPKSVIII